MLSETTPRAAYVPPGYRVSISRSMPTSTARRTRSSSQSIRSSAKARLAASLAFLDVGSVTRATPRLDQGMPPSTEADSLAPGLGQLSLTMRRTSKSVTLESSDIPSCAIATVAAIWSPVGDHARASASDALIGIVRLSLVSSNHVPS